MSINIESILKFNSLELMAINALIDPSPLFGIDLGNEVPDQETQSQQSVQIINSLTEKKILINNKHFSHEGIRIIEALRDYKTAKEFIFLNEIHLCLNPDISISLIVKHPEGTYSFLRTWPHVFMEALAAKLPWLNQHDSLSSSNPVTYLYEDNWLEGIIDYSMNRRETPESGIRDMLIVRQHRIDSAEPLKSLIYYRKESTNYLYNRRTHQHNRLPSQIIRQQIQDMLTYAKETKT